jgi:hypothetical protein
MQCADALPLKLYFGLLAFERSTNSVVRHALSSLTGQPGIVLKAHSGPPHRCSPSEPNGSHYESDH